MNVPRSEKNGESASRWPAAVRRAGALDRGRWASLAGSILAGVLVGTLLWSGGARNSLEDDLLSHIEAEADATAGSTGQVDADTVAGLLERNGIRLGAEAGVVRYARNCQFRGRTVPHLVLQTEVGPVTLLVLRDEQVEAPASFTGRGFSGRIVPAGPGSIAVVGAAGADFDQVATRTVSAVEWLR
jgi:hypothetical protein